MERAKPTIITPIIHWNGSGKAQLIGALCQAHEAVYQAMQTLRRCSPNGRDYYPEPGRLQKAEEQHRARQEHLQAVMDSLTAEAIAINEENPERER